MPDVHMGRAYDAPAAARPNCTRCNAKLSPRNTVWLELDQRDNTYHARRDVPADKSQGWFPFGRDCAKIANNVG